jgi:hypothetical protein
MRNRSVNPDSSRQRRAEPRNSGEPVKKESDVRKPIPGHASQVDGNQDRGTHSQEGRVRTTQAGSGAPGSAKPEHQRAGSSGEEERREEGDGD